MSDEQCTGPHSSAFDCPIHDPRKLVTTVPAPDSREWWQEVAKGLAVKALQTELDAQRAQPTREPGEAATTRAVNAAIDHECERIGTAVWEQLGLDANDTDGNDSADPVDHIVGCVRAKWERDAATIRRQAIDEAIAALASVGPRDLNSPFFEALEALRDPAHAREAGKG